MKIRLKTDEWVYLTILFCFLVFGIGYRMIIKPIQDEDSKVFPAFIEKAEIPKPPLLQPVKLTEHAPIPAPRKLTLAQERLREAGFDPFSVHPVRVK